MIKKVPSPTLEKHVWSHSFKVDLQLCIQGFGRTYTTLIGQL